MTNLQIDTATATNIPAELLEPKLVATQLKLATMYRDGGAVPQDKTMAVHWFLMAAEQGHMEAQYQAAELMLEDNKLQKPPYTAEVLLKMAAESGHVTSQYQLGLIYLHGDSCERNWDTAARWFHSAALQDHAKAQNKLGYCYGKGYGTKKNFARAYYWYDQAAELGEKQATYMRKKMAKQMTEEQIASCLKLSPKKF